jgi:hypothetical protein
MEPSTLFAEFVLGMCAIHLIRQTSDQVLKWWAKSHPQQGKAVANAGQKVERSDWYVFFSCADLLGKEPKKVQDQARKSAENKKTGRDRRPVARM